MALHRGWPLLRSLALARIFAVALNYPFVRGAVFRSSQRHERVLPKYLILALANAAATYAGIRLLGSAGMAAFPAKLSIGSLLFLVDFAIQRLYIFSIEPAGLPDRWRRRDLPLAPVVAAVFLGSLALEAHGFLTANLFSQDIWEPVGVKRFLRYLGMFLGIALPLL